MERGRKNILKWEVLFINIYKKPYYYNINTYFPYIHIGYFFLPSYFYFGLIFRISSFMRITFPHYSLLQEYRKINDYDK